MECPGESLKGKGVHTFIAASFGLARDVKVETYIERFAVLGFKF